MSTGPIRTEIDRLDAADTAAAAAIPTSHVVYSFPVDLSLVTAAADIVTDFIPGFKGQIEDVKLVMTEAGTGAGADIALGLDVEATEVTGGAIALVLADSTYGKYVAGSAVTAGYAFSATQKITLKAKTVTVAFTTGKCVVMLRVKPVV